MSAQLPNERNGSEEDTSDDCNDETEDLKNEDILESTIGHFGKWQCKISILMAFLKLPIAWFQLSIVFLAPPTTFWCAKGPSFQYMSDLEWLNFTKDSLPLKIEGLNAGYCQMVDVERDNKSMVSCIYGYVYNNTIFKNSLISEWGLVCGRERLLDLSQVTIMLGVLIGNLIFGIMADKFGRKPVLMICLFCQSFIGITASFIPCYLGFIFVRFLLGIANGGTMVTSFVVCMEIVGGKWRTIVPILYQIPFGFGNSIMAGIAYLTIGWRQFHFVISILSIVFIFYYWCVPESPRWLLAVGRTEEAMDILKKAAIENGRNPLEVDFAMTNLSNNHPKKAETSSFGALSSPRLRRRSALLCLNWMIVGITFYAFSQYLGTVSHNLYFTVAVGGLISLPGTILCVFVVGTCGRRWAIFTAHLVTAICFFLILLVPKGAFVQDWPRIGFAALGIIGMSVSMPALYLFTGELFPTTVRNAGVGVSVMFARIGSMLAPLIISLQDISTLLPLIMLGIATLTEAILILPLPETKDQKLPETVEDLENSESKKSFVADRDYVEVPQH